MKAVARLSLFAVALAAALVSGCGGNVSLGGKGSAGSSSSETGEEPEASTDPNLFPSQPVTLLAKDFSLGTLAVAGDFLYFSGVNAKQAGELYRCRKTDCDATRELLKTVSGAIASLQVVGDRLGVTNYANGNFWLGSYGLPGATDPQIAIGDLPAMNAVSSQFLGDFVYFALGIDEGIYRCSLPECPNGPERIGLARRTAPGGVQVCADGQLVFWTDRALIYRAGDYGHDPARGLLPDAELSEAPAGAMASRDELADDVGAMTAGEGALYAAVKDPAADKACGAACPRQIMRWPTSGGPGEMLFSTDAMVRGLYVFGSELAWVALSFTSLGVPEETSTLSTCQVDACEATRRDLGKVGFGGPVADEHDLYWLEAQPTEADHQDPRGSDVWLRQIRRAARLSAQP